jgi:predicted Rossmann fold flavoprotein
MMNDGQPFDTIIIGAGAAGLYCAGLLGQQGFRVLLIELNKHVGRKILISGGGRCNFTNLESHLDDFHSENPHFFKSALSRYRPTHFISLVEKYQIPYYEKKLGQLFCEKSAKDIVNMLLSECTKGGVDIRTSTKVLDVSFDSDHFIITTDQGNFSSKNCVISCGGLAFPALGANDFGYKIAKKFGIKCTHPRPALVPFVLDEPLVKLSGVSCPVEITTADKTYQDDLLFTHKGLSGPAILKISLFWNPGEKIKINFLPHINLESELALLKTRKPKLRVESFLKEHLPARLIDDLSSLYQLRLGIIGELGKKDLTKIAQTYNCFVFIPKETEGYRKAEVTRGGVSTDELSSKTLEAKKQSGLFFIGEVVDVTGLLGGYNFQWAWASAFAVAQAHQSKNSLS